MLRKVLEGKVISATKSECCYLDSCVSNGKCVSACHGFKDFGVGMATL